MGIGRQFQSIAASSKDKADPERVRHLTADEQAVMHSALRKSAKLVHKATATPASKPSGAMIYTVQKGANTIPCRAPGGRPRLENVGKTLSATKPWDALNMSRSSWYLRKAEKDKKEAQ